MKYAIFIFTLLALSCKSSVSSKPGTERSAEKQGSGSKLEPLYCEDIIKASDLPANTDYKLATISGYTMKEGCVCIRYQYSGCRKGERRLVWDGEFSENTRPEVLMKLMVSNAGDCDQLLSDSTCFSMKKMQLIGNQVLVYLNSEENNILLNFEEGAE